MWRYCGTSVKGDKSDHEICQDKCCFVNEGDVYCMSVCDGASTCVDSHIGAEFFSKSISDFIAKRFDELYEGDFEQNVNTLFELHQAAMVDFDAYLQKLGKPSIISGRSFVQAELYKYCTTVQTVAVKGDKALFYRVGNGSAAAVGANGPLLLAASDHEGKTNHFTFKKTMDNLLNCNLKKLTVSESTRGFMLFSDGVDFKNGLFFEDKLTDKAARLFDDISNTPPSQRQEKLCEMIEGLAKLPDNYVHDDISAALLIRERDSAAPVENADEDPAIDPNENAVSEDSTDDSAENARVAGESVTSTDQAADAPSPASANDFNGSPLTVSDSPEKRQESLNSVQDTVYESLEKSKRLAEFFCASSITLTVLCFILVIIGVN